VAWCGWPCSRREPSPFNASDPLHGWAEVGGQRLEIAGTVALLPSGLAVAAPKGAGLSGALRSELSEE